MMAPTVYGRWQTAEFRKAASGTDRTRAGRCAFHVAIDKKQRGDFTLFWRICARGARAGKASVLPRTALI